MAIFKVMKIRLFLFCLLVLGGGSITGCSQTPHTYSEREGFTMDYPSVGQDISDVVQDVLNRQGDPRTNENATNGPVVFHVSSAKVMQAGDLVPSPDGWIAGIWFHGHVTMILPNGQTVEADDFEALRGIWQAGKVTKLNINQIIGSSYAYGSPPDLYLLTAKALSDLREIMASAHDRGTMQAAICDATSIETLFWELRGHDLVHATYDFSTWKECNNVAMAHADEVFCGTGDALPPDLAPKPAVTQALTPPPAPPTKEIIDRFGLLVAHSSFNVPITDPSWFQYKSSLLTPRFDQDSWAKLEATMTRLELEQRVHDVMLQRLKSDQQRAHQKNGPYESRLAQAAYVAGQSGATIQEKNSYRELCRESEAKLGPSMRFLMAEKILVDAIQDNINSCK